MTSYAVNREIVDSSDALARIHELEQRVEAAEAAASLKDHALRVLSHDLRTPLSTIVSYTELLDSAMLGPVSDRQRVALGRMRESGHYLIALLQNVLEMTRLTAGAIELQPRAFDVVSALREAVDVAVTPGIHEHEFVWQVTGQIAVFADPVRVRQVFIHLLDNVLKYTPAKTRVELCCRVEDRPQPRAVITFSDDGPGIPPDLLPNLFEPFERAPGQGADGEVPGGTGLGLALARGLVEQMGGSIDVVSEAARGTTFTIRLPLAAG